jgi:hypothetical protein
MPAFLPTLALIVPLALGTPTPSPTDAERAEVARIQRHFDGALAMLDARDVSSLTADQRVRRATLTDVLRAYRDRGLFPRNYDFPGQAMPYFIDRRTGVLCAVAHLMESTGERALVDAVADADNNVWVPQLAGNAAFEAWLDENGLTIEEAARIQVPYVGDPVEIVEAASQRAATSRVMTALGASAGTAALVQFVPKLKSTRTGALVAFAAGTFATATAVGGFGNEADPGLATITIGTGLLNYYISGRSFGRYRAAERSRRANISPIIPTGREQGTGLMISLTF